jgi:hypothetical protein
MTPYTGKNIESALEWLAASARAPSSTGQVAEKDGF